MTVYVAGGEADIFEPVSGTYAFEQTAGRFEANLSRGAMKVTNGSTEIYVDWGSNLTTGWYHWYQYQENDDEAETDYILFYNTGGTTPAYKIGIGSDGVWSLYKYSGSSWSSALAASSGAVLDTAAGDIDVYIVTHASTGEFTVYKNGTQVVTFSGDTSIDAAGVGRVHFAGLTTASREMNISQFIAASENTIGWKVATLYADGNSGTNTDWTGDYTAIDEFVYDNGDFIETNATDQVETFTAADINASYSTYNVKAVVVGARASNDTGSSVSDIQAAIRTNSTNYFSSNLSLTKDSAEHSVFAVFETNPDTASAWSQSEVNGAEFGLKSV